VLLLALAAVLAAVAFSVAPRSELPRARQLRRCLAVSG
jgi:hypothetical protein